MELRPESAEVSAPDAPEVDPVADKVPGSGKVNKVWDLRGFLSLLFDKGLKCKDFEPGEPPPVEADEVFLRITGGTTRLDDLFRLVVLLIVPFFEPALTCPCKFVEAAVVQAVLGKLGERPVVDDAAVDPPGLRLILTP